MSRDMHASKSSRRQISTDLYREAIAAAEAGIALYKHPRKAPPLTATPFEHMAAHMGIMEAGTAVQRVYNAAGKRERVAA